MLHQLDSLSRNIARLVSIVDENRQRLRQLQAQLSEVRAERDAARADLERVIDERETLREERDALSSKIEDAQVRLNAILEKLPRHKPNENQLDLLAPEPDPQQPEEGETHEQ